MDKMIDRLFPFIEMFAITALIKAVMVPAYPFWGIVTASALTSMACYYLISPVIEAIVSSIIKRSTKSEKVIITIVFCSALTSALMTFWMAPFVGTASDLIKSTISINQRKN